MTPPDDLGPAVTPNDLDAFWVPFTPNAEFKQSPRLVARAEGMHYYTPEGRAVLDATAGLWFANVGHGRAEVADAVRFRHLVEDLDPLARLGDVEVPDGRGDPEQRRDEWLRRCGSRHRQVAPGGGAGGDE